MVTADPAIEVIERDMAFCAYLKLAKSHDHRWRHNPSAEAARNVSLDRVRVALPVDPVLGSLGLVQPGELASSNIHTSTAALRQKQPLKNRRAGYQLFTGKQKRFTHGVGSALCQSPTVFDEFENSHIAAT